MMIEPSEESINYYVHEVQNASIAELALTQFLSEGQKGCTGEVFQKPLTSIVPPYELFSYNKATYDTIAPVLNRSFNQNKKQYECISFLPVPTKEKHGFLENGFHFLSQCATITYPFHIELIAICGSVHWQIRYPKTFRNLVESSLASNFNQATIHRVDYLNKFQPSSPTTLCAFYPEAPYYRNLLTPKAKSNISLLSLFSAVSNLKDDEWFMFRISIEPALHIWANNCQNLFSYERNIFKLYKDLSTQGNYFVNPTFESKNALSQKISPNNLPLFFVSPMIAYSGSAQNEISLKSFMNSYRFGDHPYNEADLLKLNQASIKDIIYKGKNFVEGHLVNKEECSNFLLQPCDKCFESYSHLMSFPKNEEGAKEGIILGKSGKRNIILPYSAIPHSLTILGNPGKGKSTLLQSILSQVAKTDSSVILFYFNEIQFCFDLISALPTNRLDDVVFATPQLNGKVLARNLVERTNMNPRTQSSGLAFGLENATTSLGIDIKYFLKNALLMAISHNNTSLEDIICILDKDEPWGKMIRSAYKKKTKSKQVLKLIEYIETNSSDVKKIQNKLQELFDSEESASMFSYSGENLLSYKDIVENKKILIWYLGGLGSAGNAIASMETSLIYEHFLQYGKIHPTPVHKTLLAIDEAQRIQATGLTKCMRENRRHGFSLAFSMQSLIGVDPAISEAVNLTSNIVTFQCPEYDARYFNSKTSGLIKSADIMSLNKYEAYVRTMSSQNVSKFKTNSFNSGDMSKVDYVIERSLTNYYKSTDEENSTRTLPSPKTKIKDSANYAEQLNYFKED